MLSLDALRLTTIKTLMGRTWAGARVFDSPANPANLRIEEERAPFVAVYVDDGDLGEGPEGEPETFVSFGLTPPEVWLIIQCGVATSIAIDPATGKPVNYDLDGNPINDEGERVDPAAITTLAETDAAAEMQIGFLATQAINALLATDNLWGELWRQYTAAGLRKVEVRRGGNDMPGTEGVRFASRLMRLRVQVLPTPPQGSELPENGWWARFFAMTEADADSRDLGRLMKAHMTLLGGGMLVDWRRAQKELGVSEETIRELGISPVITPEDAHNLLTNIATDHPDGGAKRELDPDLIGGEELPPNWPYPDM
jgi:hypothetical protein